ncbi:MAG: zinc ABC transporter substrate-binding protein [Oscillospiraceae bacterium]|nr:zinc ABC transporter substrate-binding protein [Oscillospiraceae bacterium]
MKRVLCAVLCAVLLSACAAPAAPEDGRLRIVTTLFPYYDFARAIVGDRAEVTLLLSPGREAHSFEPTPLDAVTISRADVLIYNGGESEEWVDEMLDAAGEHIGTILNMMESVDALEEEFVEGMQGAEDEEPDEDSDEIEYDEHIWTSPANAAVLCQTICDALCEVDKGNSEVYQSNCAVYVARLNELDARFRALREGAARDLIVFADRMPLLYFCEAYDLRYRAAFHGCSTDTEPSLATLKYLIDKVAEEDIPVVYTVDLDSRRIAEVVAECTGAEIETLYSLQTVSRADFDAGETYLTMMERNLRSLERGLA